MQTSQIVNGG